MKSLILLGLISGDWDDVNECFVQAEALWRIVRRWHPEGDDERVDSAMKEIRESLKDLDASLRDEDPFEYDRLEAFTVAVAEHDAGVEEARAAMQNMDVDDEMGISASANEPLKSEEIAEQAPASQAKKVSQKSQCKGPANIQLQPKDPLHLKLAIGPDSTD